MTNQKSLVLTIKEEIKINGQGLATCSRKYHLVNNTDTVIALNGISFKPILSQNSWNINVHESFNDPKSGQSDRRRPLYYQPFTKFGKQVVEWILEKPSLNPKEEYYFLLTWEIPNVFQRAGTRYIFHYEFHAEQMTPYELIISLPEKREMLENNNSSIEGESFFLRALFGRILYETSTTNPPMGRSYQNKRLCLNYNAPVSQNNPLDIWVFYFVKIPPIATFTMGIFTGLLPNILWDFLKGSIKKLP